MEQVHAVVLAAGKGKRMRSDLPKVLHPVCGQPLIFYVLDALHHAGISSSIVVVGHGADRDGRVRKIVEEADCSSEERQVMEINAGTYMFRQQALREALRALTPGNAQGEYYLTDTIGWLLGREQQVSALVASAEETVGVNSRQELAAAESLMRRRLLDRLMEGGVTIIDPVTTYVHAGVQVGPDTVIHPQSYLEGATAVGARCTIGPQARLVDATVGDGVTIVASSVERGAVGEGSTG